MFGQSSWMGQHSLVTVHHHITKSRPKISGKFALCIETALNDSYAKGATVRLPVWFCWWNLHRSSTAYNAGFLADSARLSALVGGIWVADGSEPGRFERPTLPTNLRHCGTHSTPCETRSKHHASTIEILSGKCFPSSQGLLLGHVATLWQMAKKTKESYKTASKNFSACQKKSKAPIPGHSCIYISDPSHKWFWSWRSKWATRDAHHMIIYLQDVAERTFWLTAG